MGIRDNKPHAAFHLLKVILEPNLTSLRLVVEGIFQGEANITCIGETNHLGHGLFGERGEEKAEGALVSSPPRQVFVEWSVRVDNNIAGWQHNSSVNVTK